MVPDIAVIATGPQDEAMGPGNGGGATDDFGKATPFPGT